LTVTQKSKFSSKAALHACGAAALFCAASVFAQSAIAQEAPTEAPSAHLKIEQIQVAFIGSGAVGGGTLDFQGKTYKFSVKGLGVGGFGASRLSATGEVYGLKKLEDFAGPYAEVRTGFAVGDFGKGRFWLRNANGVYLKIEGSRQGAQVGVGAEAVLITLDE
jgi:hypothetical protein